MLWVQNELSYDKFHGNSDKIFRVIQYDKEGKNSCTPALFAPKLASEIPEISSYTRIFKLPRLIFKHGSNIFHEDNGIVVDPQFLEIFDFSFVKGDPKTALSEPSNIIITESLALKYFGSDDPINKIIDVDGKAGSVVTGVIKDVPSNSHLQFDFILPFCLMKLIMPNDITNWGAFNYTTYLQLAPGVNTKGITEKINQLIKDKIPQEVLPFWNKFELQPLAQCHLSADISNDHFLGNFTVVEDRNTVYIFSCIAFLILFLACINFMNLSIAQSGGRTLEIGLKKVMGSTRNQLTKQFMGEFLLLSVMAFGLAIVIANLILPFFNNISGKELVINHSAHIFPFLLILYALRT